MIPLIGFVTHLVRGSVPKWTWFYQVLGTDKLCIFDIPERKNLFNFIVVIHGKKNLTEHHLLNMKMV